MSDASARDPWVPRLHDRAILVTGAAGGIGASLVDFLAAAGTRVAAFDLEPISRPDVLSLQVDVAEAGAVEEAVARVEREVGALDGLVNNAAVTDVAHRPVHDLPLGVWSRVQRVNVFGSLVTTQVVLRRMAPRKRGNIVFVTSSLGQPRSGVAGDAPYSASKAALEALAWVLSRETIDLNLNVNTVYPSVRVDTGFFAHLPEGERATLARPTILDGPTGFLLALRPASLTGVSLSQQAWNDDPTYRADLVARAERRRS